MEKHTLKLLDKESDVRRLAMDCLARQECTRKQLFDKIKRRCDNHELINSVLDYMESEGYQSDQRFAASFVRSRSERGQGVRKISFDLKRKGICDDLIREVFETQPVDSKQCALDYVRRKYGEEPPCDKKAHAKWVRHLAGRGFNFDEIKYALRYQIQDPEMD